VKLEISFPKEGVYFTKSYEHQAPFFYLTITMVKEAQSEVAQSIKSFF
jgi:hypothetical protein